MTTDRLGGVTYSFSNLANFLGDTASNIDFNLRRERAEPVQQRRHRAPVTPSSSTSLPTRRTSGGSRANMTLNYGLRYEYYTPMQRGEQPRRPLRPRHRDAQAAGHEPSTQSTEQLPAARGVHVCTGKDGVPDRVRHSRRPRSDRGSDSADRKRPRVGDAVRRRVSGRRGRVHRAIQPERSELQQPQRPCARLRQRLQRFRSASISTPRRSSRSCRGAWP